jgi:uncharacterized DUF497 family protein
MEFDWDSTKALKNMEKHGVSVEEAATIFEEELSATIVDGRHSANDDRFNSTGLSGSGRVLMVAHADFDGITRVISSREVTLRARRDYEYVRRNKRGHGRLGLIAGIWS